MNVNSTAMERKDFPVVLMSFFEVDFGVRHISSFCRQAGFPVYIVRFSRLMVPYAYLDDNYFANPPVRNEVCDPRNLKAFMELLSTLKPKVVGMSVCSPAMQTARLVTAAIKKRFDIPVVWGGIHAILAPEECMQYADMVCTGEGEYAFRELLEQLRSGVSPHAIKNLWIRRRDGTIEKNAIRPLVENLDELPFPDFEYTNNKFTIDEGNIIDHCVINSGGMPTFYWIMTSRGCMNSCNFCCNSIIRQRYEGCGSYLRRRSVNHVIGELRQAIQSQFVSLVWFWDDIFTYDKAWIDEFVDVYMDHVGKAFLCYGHPRFTDEVMLKKLASVGLTCVNVGIQSGSESVSKKVMGRNQRNDTFVDYARIAHKNFIIPRFDLITDNPYETDADNDEVTDLLLDLPHPFRLNFYSLCYYPCTPLTERAISDGFIRPDQAEQYTSKSLANFFMFIRLSQNKKDFFWNCLKAMAINRYVPKRLVRFCKKRKFLRRHPALLYYPVKLCMGLACFIRQRLFLKRRHVLYSYPALAQEVVPMEWYTCLPHHHSKFWFKGMYFFHLYPQASGDSRRFCLKIVKIMNVKFSLRVVFEMMPMPTFSRKKRALWEFCVSGDFEKEKHIMIDMQYPDLYYSINGARRRASTIRSNIDHYRPGELYALKLKYRLPIIGIYLPITHVLFREKQTP